MSHWSDSFLADLRSQWREYFEREAERIVDILRKNPELLDENQPKEAELNLRWSKERDRVQFDAGNVHGLSYSATYHHGVIGLTPSQRAKVEAFFAKGPPVELAESRFVGPISGLQRDMHVLDGVFRYKPTDISVWPYSRTRDELVALAAKHPDPLGWPRALAYFDRHVAKPEPARVTDVRLEKPRGLPGHVGFDFEGSRFRYADSWKPISDIKKRLRPSDIALIKQCWAEGRKPATQEESTCGCCGHVVSLHIENKHSCEYAGCQCPKLMPPLFGDVTPSGEVKAPECENCLGGGGRAYEDSSDHIGHWCSCANGRRREREEQVQTLRRLLAELPKNDVAAALSDHIRRGDGESMDQWEALMSRASKAETERDTAIGQRNMAIIRAEEAEELRDDLDEACQLLGSIVAKRRKAVGEVDLTELREWYADDCGRVRILRSHLPLLADIVERLVGK